jgi:hypothetical protein
MRRIFFAEIRDINHGNLLNKTCRSAFNYKSYKMNKCFNRLFDAKEIFFMSNGIYEMPE